MLQIGDQCGLSGLAFQISAQMCTTEPAAQLLFLSAQAVLTSIARAGEQNGVFEPSLSIFMLERGSAEGYN